MSVAAHATPVLDIAAYHMRQGGPTYGQHLAILGAAYAVSVPDIASQARWQAAEPTATAPSAMRRGAPSVMRYVSLGHRVASADSDST
eukprot:2724881-Rhodomonas_salina.12